VIRIVVALIWIGLILATALTRQVVANWVLSAGLAMYLLLRWRSRRARIAPRRLPSHEQLVAGQPRQSRRVPGLADHRQHPSARWH
jgi:steroid 5-alpha reductase family enzyme